MIEKSDVLAILKQSERTLSATEIVSTLAKQKNLQVTQELFESTKSALSEMANTVPPSVAGNEDGGWSATAVADRIPPGITREDVLGALQVIEESGLGAFGPSTTYDFVFQGRRYPPKAVLGIAARRLNGGTPLKPSDFSGGEASKCFKVLRDLGFEVLRKDSTGPQDEKNNVEKRYWVEKTIVKGRPDREYGPHALGAALWSPQVSKDGKRIYESMRAVQPGDVIFHLTDNEAITMVSVVAACADDTFIGLSGSDWAGQAGFRIPLENATKLSPPLQRSDFLSNESFRSELLDILANHSSLFYNRKLELNQGAYLTPAPNRLVQLLATAYLAATGLQLPHVELDVTAPVPKPRENARWWAIGAGEGGRRWNEFQEKKIIAVGWDDADLGDLIRYPSKSAIFEQLVDRYGGNPTNDALCAFEFAHQMQAGDYVIAKIGRSRTLGVGIIESDYIFDATRESYKHIRKVKWLASKAAELPPEAAIPIKTLTEVTEHDAFVSFITGHYLSSVSDPAKSIPFSVADAASEMFLSEDEIEKLLSTWRRKKNLILQGAPGVGKTFAARNLAYALIGAEDETRLQMVQFHQSYSYEDFVQGWRPTGNGNLQLRNGLFYEFCDTARIDPERPYVFVIDEINRGNLSRIFGELMMLIECDKRGQKYGIPLTYSDPGGEKFSVPENVYILGLMNTADRSLSLVDYALRRRFSFFTLEPQFGSSKFADYLRARDASDDLIHRIRNKMHALNEVIRTSRDLGPGFQIGHSFFCPSINAKLDNEWYLEVVNSEVIPLLSEYWFDHPEKVEDLAQVMCPR